MDPITTVTTAASAATALVNGARWVLTQANDVNTAIQNAKTNSLTAFTKTTTMTAPVFIDGALANEKVVVDLLKGLLPWYAGVIMNALQLNQLVTGTKTVRDMLRVVASEDYRSVVAGFEAFDMATAGKIADAANDFFVNDLDKSRKEKEKAIDNLVKNRVGAQSVVLKDATLDGSIVPLGKLIQVTLTNPENEKANVTLTLQVQLFPRIIPANVAPLFISLNASPTWAQRWIQYKVGEISFISDFLFQMDRIEARSKALKGQGGDAFYDFMENQVKKDQRTAHDMLMHGEPSRNTANAVLMFSMDAVRRAKAEAGVDILKNAAQRQAYFADTYAMMLVVVDPAFGRVHIFFNGQEQGGTYTFDQFSGSKKGLEAEEVLKALANSRAPKF